MRQIFECKVLNSKVVLEEYVCLVVVMCVCVCECDHFSFWRWPCNENNDYILLKWCSTVKSFSFRVASRFQTTPRNFRYRIILCVYNTWCYLKFLAAFQYLLFYVYMCYVWCSLFHALTLFTFPVSFPFASSRSYSPFFQSVHKCSPYFHRCERLKCWML